MARQIITLLTDFGTRDAYVASMKGVILGINPQAVLVDLSHEIGPQDVRAGALVLAGAAPYFPPGAIHLAVVDPGVGGSRRALAARARGQFWVGPDNGLFHFALAGNPEARIVSLENPAFFLPQMSATFHGRDLFAPVAAHLSLGVDPALLGPPLTDPVLLNWSEAEYGPGAARGVVIYVDRFGNLVTNFQAVELRDWLGGRDLRLKLGGLSLRGLARTYGDGAPGEFLALVGSHGFLEVACNRESAAQRLNTGLDAVIEITKD
jgi:hypothetical protein